MSVFQVGASQVDITPVAGTHLSGSGAGVHRGADTILDPLHARAVVFEKDGQRICLLALDVTIITRQWTEQIKHNAARRWGLHPEAIMVHATQTHSAPSLGDFMFDDDFPHLAGEKEYLRGSEAAYSERAVAGAVEAIGRAIAALRPAQIGVGSAVRDGLAFNRRGVTREGKVVMPWMYSSLQYPLGPTHIRYIEGPTDPEVGVLCARTDDMRMVAMLLHYTCHPVNVYAQPGNAVSADWPGAWCSEMQKAYGEACTPLVLNGCCGNINPWPAFQADFHPDHRRMGAALGDAARAVVQQMRFAQAGALSWKARRIALPLKAPDPERLAMAQRILAEHPEPLWTDATPQEIDPRWFQAASIMSVELMRRRGPTLEYEIQAFRVGDVAIVGLPGEPFVEGQLEIKIGSPAYHTFVAHCTTQYVGYLPTRDAFRRGGHEVDFSYWAKLAPEALETVVRNAVSLLKELF